MFLHKTMSFRRAFPMAAGPTPLLALGLLLGGCSHLPWIGHRGASAPPSPAMTSAPAAASESAAAGAPQTVTSDLPEPTEAAAEGQVTTVIADAATELSPTAPKSYVVQRGDTLWHLAGMFLKDPWLWPEIWYVNPEVSNPHRIYPGDTLRLAKGTDGRQAVQLMRTSASAGGGGAGTRLEPLLRTTALEAPIANIPYGSIAAFLSRPGVLTKAQVESAPYVLALRDRHMIAGAGNDIYVRRLTGAEGERFSVLHVGERLRDPDGDGTLGYLAVYAGLAQVTQAGDPARAQINESAREVLTGDVLIAESGGSYGDIVPRAPTARVQGRILAIVNGVLLAGQYQVVAINRGSQQGLEPGHVLRVNAAAQTVRDRCARINGNGTCTRFGDTALPLESAGTLLVFRVFDHVSYALVAAETAPIAVGDRVVNP
jgi:hypothetical protein